MKFVKGLFLSAAVFLAAAALAGCSNPISPDTAPVLEQAAPVVEQAAADSGYEDAEPAAEAEPDRGTPPQTPDIEPFTVTISINEDGSARFVAGPSSSVIGTGGICNFVQLVVIDPNEGAPVVHTLTADRQALGQSTATLTVQNLQYSKEYEFLLLLGHWERNYSVQGSYAYKDNLPTLLVAGYKKASITPANNEVNVQMYPLVVDTKFKTTNTNITVNTVDDGIFSLLPESWKVEWTVGGKDGNGFTDLEAARKTDSLFKDPIARVGTGAAQNSGINEPNGRVITLNLGALQVENEGSANFNLKYVPFSLNSADKWAGFTALNKKEGVPVWIIRNGINDQAQNSNTDFSSPGTDWAGTKNGNGAVAFKVFAPVTGITDVPKTTAVGTLTLSGTVVPSNAINKTITWSIKDAGTTGATINGNVLTTTTLGTVTVRATIANGTTIGAAYTQDFDIDVIVPVTGISFNNTEYVVYTGKTITVPPIITPATATNQVVSWTSSPSNTATVDSSSGLVTGIKVGTAYITAKSADGPTGSYKVTVKQYVPVTGISLSTDTFLLEKGASSKNLSNFITATVTPTDASPLYSGVTWSISPESIATLSGTPPWIKPQGVGTATLTATNTDSGVTATCTVEVVSGRFVVISSTGGVSWSVDGIKWNKVTAQLDNAYRWSAAVYDGTKFVTVGWEFASARKNKIAYSTDGGESWMEKPIDPPPNGSFWWKLAYGGGKFVMVPDSYKTSPYIAYSTNGTTWTQHSTAGVMGEGLAGGAYIYYAKDKFIVLPDGVNNTNGAYSTNGTTWTLMTMPAPPNNLQWGDLAYGKGKFVVVPGVEHYSTVETKSILISDNGTSWTQMNALPNRTWVSVIFGGDKFVAFPYSNGTDKGAYSTDGQSWSVANIPALAGTHSGTASYGNGRFVAIHANNAVWSKDGITWTQTQNSVFSTGYESGTITYGAKN